MTTKFTRKDFEQRIDALYAFALEQGYQIIALGPGNKGHHHYLVKREESFLEVSLNSQGTLLLSTEQGMSVYGRITPVLLRWFEREGLRHELDEPFSRQACQYLAGENNHPVHAPGAAQEHRTRLALREGDIPIMDLLPCPSGWFAVYARDPDGVSRNCLLLGGR